MENDKKKESKRERFVRVAESRTNKIIDMIHLLGNCSNTAVYDYRQEDIEKIFSAIEAELAKARKRFVNSESEKYSRFTLEE